MRRVRIVSLGIIILLGLSVLASCTSGKMSAAEKSNVQTAMKEFVDNKLARDGNVYKIEDKSGIFDYLHEGVKKKGDINISCADVKVGDDIFDIDYHVKNENGKYIVVKEILHKINKEEINKVLWEKNN